MSLKDFTKRNMDYQDGRKDRMNNWWDIVWRQLVRSSMDRTWTSTSRYTVY